jgi:alginate O-acetyltransferase complex protein AlgJ
MSKPARALSGEAEAIADIASTRSTRLGRLLLLIVFCAFTAVVAGLNLRALGSSWLGLASAWLRGSNLSAGASWWDRLQDGNGKVLQSMRAIDEAYDEKSPLAALVQPRVQAGLLRLGEGTDEVVIGREGWLFHRSGIAMMSGRPKPGVMREGLEAIGAFAQYLRSRGVSLVLMPVPPKIAVHPRQFDADLPATLPAPQHWLDWKRQVEASGAEVLDLWPLLTEAAAKGAPLYLKTDTHWNPQAMEMVAEKLASFLIDKKWLGPSREEAAKTSVQSVSAVGDLARMLRLSAQANPYPPETVSIRQVHGATGLSWQPSEQGELLLMGDSFCNIYSQKSLGWGTGGGFAEQLSRLLGRPIGILLRNGDGAHATRAILARQLQTGQDRLKGRRVVVWEFDATQIMQGNWKPLDYRLGKAPASSFLEVAAGPAQSLTGTVVSVSAVPVPGSVAYRDYLATLHLRDLRRTDGQALTATELLAYGMAMRENKWTALADLRPGDEVRVQVRAWSQVEAEYGPLSRGEPEGDLFLQPINWLDSVEAGSPTE